LKKHDNCQFIRFINAPYPYKEIQKISQDNTVQPEKMNSEQIIRNKGEQLTTVLIVGLDLVVELLPRINFSYKQKVEGYNSHHLKKQQNVNRQQVGARRI
jgi:hypothetical protein